MNGAPTRILLDAGVFIAAARDDRATLALLKSARARATLVTAAHSFAEFYRGGSISARESRLLNAWRPAIIAIGEREGRLAGELLASTGRDNSMDALVVAVADLHAITEIFTTDDADVRELRDARNPKSRPIAVTRTG